MVIVYRAPSRSIFQRDARSPRMSFSGPSRTRPLNTSETRSRSACVRAVSGLIELGRLITPIRMAGSALGSGVDVGPTVGWGVGDGVLEGSADVAGGDPFGRVGSEARGEPSGPALATALEV